MPEKPTPDHVKRSPLRDVAPARAILGRRISAVLLKRRRDRTKHPYNRMFLMFDDGAGMEFFFPGLLLPHEIMDANSFGHIARRRRRSETVRVAFRARMKGGNLKELPEVASFCRGARIGKDDAVDKGIVREILGRRIAAIYHFIEIDKERPSRYLDFVFFDGTAFEFVALGPVLACNRLESFDLCTVIQRGANAYYNELLVVEDPDSDRVATPINQPHRWSDLEE